MTGLLQRSGVRRSFYLLFVLVSAGCVSMSSNKPPPTIFLLENTFVSSPVHSRSESVVVVNMPQSAPGYGTSQIAYQRSKGELEYFASHRWAETPVRMLLPLMVKALEQNGGFKAVVAGPTPIKANLFVDSELLLFRQEFSAKGSSFHSILRVQIRTEGGEVLATRIFDMAEQAEKRDPRGGMLAANTIIERLMPEVAAFVLGTGIDAEKGQ